jgi:Tfp pilus assembly protein FimT
MMAVPSYTRTNINNRLTAESTQLNNVLAFARNESYRRNNYVSVCASTTGNSCDSTDFAKGVVVFNDPGQAGLSNANQVLKIYDKWAGSEKGKITVTGNIFTFNGVPNAINAGTILVCYPTYDSYTITVNNVGSIKTVKNVGDGGC